MQCTNCKSEIQATAKFCPECGNKVEIKGKTCNNKECNRTGLPPEALFCPDCGTRLSGGFSSFTETVNGVSFDMAAIKGGTFTMGSPASEVSRQSNEGPQHQVTLSAFAMGKHEVTQALWQAVMGSNPSYFKGDNLPVEHVSWNDCQAFISKLNQITGKTYRLPTEAEWEYACRAGSTTPFNTGSNIFTAQANFNGNYPYNNNPKGIYRNNTMSVGSFAPNAWGLYDMHGNVFEWCEDDWHENYYGSPTDNRPWVDSPRGLSRVIRGGSYQCSASYCRSATRSSNRPNLCYNRSSCNSHDNSLGFRLVLVP